MTDMEYEKERHFNAQRVAVLSTGSVKPTSFGLKTAIPELASIFSSIFSVWFRTVV